MSSILTGGSNSFMHTHNNSTVQWIIPSGDDPNVVLVGYKGHSEFESGFFYCPYGPNGEDYRPIWREKKRQKAKDHGWCLGLFDELNVIV